MLLSALPLALPIALLLLLLPGLALLRLVPRALLTLTERVALALGLGGALYPILLLWSEPIGLHWNGALAWLLLGICALVTALPERGEGWQAAWQRRRDALKSPSLWLLLGLTAAAVGLRFVTARDLLAGPWGDSYHHTLIADLLARHGGLFSSWQPYAPLQTLTYHYGFHSQVAALNWLSGTPPTLGLLVIGQVQSALVVPLIWLLTRRLTGNERSAFAAALLAGFVSLMPAYYVNWGRYTQLAGQNLLLGVAVVWMLLIDAALRPLTPSPSPTRGEGSQATPDSEVSVTKDPLLKAKAPLPLWERGWDEGRMFLLAALASAGMVLTHYRIAVFAACFVAAYFFAAVFTTESIENRKRVSLYGLRALRVLRGSMIVIVGALLLSLPWLLRLREGRLLMIGQYYAGRNVGATETNSLPDIGPLFSLYLQPELLVLALAGLAALLFAARKSLPARSAVITLGLWTLLVGLAANPYLLNLPGAGLLTNFAVLIALYLVLCPLGGAFLGFCADGMRTKLTTEDTENTQQVPARLSVLSVFSVVTLAALAWGAWQQWDLQKLAFVLYTPADAAAMAWIRANTPANVPIFVNAFTSYGGVLYAGSDGGWWLPYATGRPSNLPPLTYGSEAAEDPHYIQKVNELNAALMAQPIGSEATAQALCKAGFRYVYNGPATSAVREFIDAAELNASPAFESVYAQDGASLWRIRLCASASSARPIPSVAASRITRPCWSNTCATPGTGHSSTRTPASIQAGSFPVRATATPAKTRCASRVPTCSTRLTL